MTASRNRAWTAGWAARLGAAAPMAAVLALALSAIAAQVASAQQGERRLGAPVQLHPNQPREAGPRTPSRAETPRKPAGAGLEARGLPGRAVEGTRVPEGIHVDRGFIGRGAGLLRRESPGRRPPTRQPGRSGPGDGVPRASRRGEVVNDAG